MPTHYYIDGYNVLHRPPLLEVVGEASLESARDALIDLVAQFCASSQQGCTLVFDGQSKRAERHAPGRGVEQFEIVYAARSQSADSWIERAVHEDPDRRDAVVVSGDRGITDLCLGLGSLAMTPDAFLAVAGDHAERVREHIARTTTRGSLGRIEDSLDGDTRDRLQAMRDRIDGGRTGK